MRLIDADALHRSLGDHAEGKSDFYRGAIYTAIMLVDDAQAVDAALVLHGRWEPYQTRSGKNWWQCSICGEVSEHKKNHNYCHFCGAKMDGESDGSSK